MALPRSYLTQRELLPDDFSPAGQIAGRHPPRTHPLHDRKDMLHFDTSQISAGKAMKQAGVVLDDIRLFEYHDVFSIFAAMQLSGWVRGGKGWKLAADG
jgi:hypothetical protein